MLTKSTIKFIKSLQEKKYRKQEQCFVVEGGKSVEEVLSSGFEVVMLVGSPEFLKTVEYIPQDTEVFESKASEMGSLGDFQTNDAALAVVRMKIGVVPRIEPNGFTLLLDDIRDPGNLGTIIRTADWYGITTILASEETVDFYSPKVINSTKGSFIRVNFISADLSTILSNNSLPVYGAFLDGESVHGVQFEKSGVLVIGNESRGISPAVEKFVTNRITIPRFGKAESLNAAIATAIILDNIKR
jgi:TrmH family RNA methyltransferase